MRTIVLIKIVILLVMLQVPAWAYHKWYDEKGIVHYTQADPPANAKNEDGSNWWAEEPNQDANKVARKKKIEQVRLKIKNSREPKPEPGTEPAQNIEENISLESEAEEPDEKSEPIEAKGLLQRMVSLFSKDDTEEPVCDEPWLLKEHGICALNKPDREKVGSTFKAEVVDNRKCVWSSCRGTYNGDIVTFTYKGQGYWETDGNVPECPFYQGFYWR